MSAVLKGHACNHAIMLGVAAALLAGAACAPASSGGGGTAGIGGGTAGAGPAGAAGAAGEAGSGPGGTSVAGAGGASLAGAGGASATGVAGMAGAPVAGAGGGGGSASGGRGGAAGAAGRGGAGVAGAGGSATGTATFTVQVQLASAMMSAAPGTIGIVTWTVNVGSLTEAHIDFGLDQSYGMSAPVDLALADHRTLLLGMKPAKLYHFRVVARDATTTYTSSDYTVMTGPAATTVSISRFQVMNATARKRRFIVTSYWSGTGSAVPFIIDGDGEIVWWGRGGPSGGIARAVMSADGKNMWMTSANNNGAAIQRLTMDALTAQTYTGTIGSHDLTPVSGELMAFLEYGETDCDSIYEIDPSGTKREIFESQGVVMANGCHANALRYSQKGDVFTFSDVRQDVFVISRAGAVQWRLSQRVTGGSMAWGGVQHGHHLLDNSIVIFANNGTSSTVSAMIEYSLTGQEMRRFSSGDFSANLGDVQRLPGGNTLVTFSNDSVMKEIDAQGNVVLQIDGASGTRFGYALWRDSLYGPPPNISQ
ncbi:MAG TPA: arylsulfotransferase family protein [Vicinamibacterales bacterium]|nr:arylsulfotransferase family protein [Vicinamibacterales bacterium]